MIGKIFKAYDVRATYPEPLNEDAGWKVGVGVAELFKKQNGGKPGIVLTSRDHRPSAPSMHAALNDGLRSAGMDVIDLGMCDTSFMYFAIPYIEGALGGVQTTASHNPIEYIGYKVSGQGAKPVGADSGLKEIQATAESLEGDCPPPVGSYEERDLWEPYRDHIRKFLSPLDKPIKVYIDACNGMATKLVPAAFGGVANLEILEENFLFTDNWVHQPNPLVAENMVPTQEGVKRTGASLGACFDGDADRCMIVDNEGNIIGCDHLTSMLAHHFVGLAKADPDQPNPTTIVYDLRSSKVVPETIEALGVNGRISKVGHVNMKANLRETGGVFGGELSGHFYFRDNSFADSGAITLAATLSVLNANPDKTITELVAPFRKYPQSGEINFHNDDKPGTIAKLKGDYGGEGDVMELDGVTIDCWGSRGWWFNVRASNTEPLLRLNAEAKDPATLETLLQEIEPKLGERAEGH